MTNDITLKEIYERLIVLETKMDTMESNQMYTRAYATKLAVLIIGSVFMDIVIHFGLWLSTN